MCVCMQYIYIYIYIKGVKRSTLVISKSGWISVRYFCPLWHHKMQNCVFFYWECFLCRIIASILLYIWCPQCLSSVYMEHSIVDNAAFSTITKNGPFEFFFKSFFFIVQVKNNKQISLLATHTNPLCCFGSQNFEPTSAWSDLKT